MEYIQGKPRSQIVLIESSLEEKIEADNPVRFIDTFVNHLKLEELGFTHARNASEGRPPYDPAYLLKLFIYGYLNRIRSSRMLERECKRNLELYWLLNELIPDHNTIANFRKDNPKAIKLVFRKMVTMCKRLDLIGGKVIATDGTKLRAQNSKKNNYNQKKIDDHLAYIAGFMNTWMHLLWPTKDIIPGKRSANAMRLVLKPWLPSLKRPFQARLQAPPTTRINSGTIWKMILTSVPKGKR